MSSCLLESESGLVGKWEHDKQFFSRGRTFAVQPYEAWRVKADLGRNPTRCNGINAYAYEATQELAGTLRNGSRNAVISQIS